MGNLPADRLREGRPFRVCGVDFCGPFYVSYRIRGRPPVKMYVAVFVCFASKAVHLDLVTDLSTDAFLNVFKRFIGRRGLPETIYSDNATNFVGASNVLRELQTAFQHNEARLVNFAAERGVQWMFIPPRAPHFGGLWEAAVKSAKHRLLRGASNANLTQDELRTHLVDVEALLNSRPLLVDSSDPSDGEVLTPGHLLIGQPLLALPSGSDPDESSKKPGRGYLRLWQQLSALKLHFWRKWSKDYLLSLQQRTQWAKGEDNLEEGAVVLVHDDNTPPQQWITGRVTRTIRGEDGKVRVAEVKTPAGVIKRPIHKLARLPMG